MIGKLYLPLLPFLGFFCQLSAATRGDQNSTDNHVLFSMGQTITQYRFRQHDQNSVLHHRPKTNGALDTAFALRHTAANYYAAHVVQWSHNATAGCSHTLPKATISCGLGGKITLVEQDPSVQSCTVSTNQNSVTCSGVAKPVTYPALIVVCTGSTIAALSATLQIPSSVVKCSTTGGGRATVVGYLARICNDGNDDYFNTNYVCTSGVKDTSFGFCVAKKSCSTSSCSATLSAVSISDTDTRAQCIGKGPGANAVAYSIFDVYWTAYAPTCTISSSVAVTLTCGIGGRIAIENYTADATCSLASTRSVKCSLVSPKLEPVAAVLFSCSGVTAGQRDAVAVMPSITASTCSSTSSNSFSQILTMDRYCSAVNPSKQCGGAAQLLYDANGFPLCGTLKTCSSTSQQKCSITLGSISIADASADLTCINVG